MFETKVIEKIIIYILCSIPFSSKIMSFSDNVEKYGTATQAIDDNKIQHRIYAICMPER
jgi:hypothetical protein